MHTPPKAPIVGFRTKYKILLKTQCCGSGAAKTRTVIGAGVGAQDQTWEFDTLINTRALFTYNTQKKQYAD
jgi:hypothetical protein